MEWSRAARNADGSYVVPADWIYIHNYEAMNLLFRIENSIRVFVFSVLKSNLGGKWQESAISTEDSQQTTISSIGKRRLNQAKQFGYLGYVSPCPLLYLSMGELVQLMFADAYWKNFAPYFMGKKELMRAKLDEIITIRNAIAHFRPLKEDDVEVIRQNAKHAMMGIDSYLEGLTAIRDSVPSNATDSWFKSLRTIGGDEVNLRFRQSDDAEWVQVCLTFIPPAMGLSVMGGWLNCSLAKLDSPQVFRLVPIEHTVFLTESLIAYVQSDESVMCNKHLYFTFKRSVLEAHEEEIVSGFSQLVLKIREEIDLLSQDNLARGEVLSLQNVYGYKRMGEDGRETWQLPCSVLECPPGEKDPPEYWGDLGWFGANNFITKRAKYPWMPSSISS